MYDSKMLVGSPLTIKVHFTNGVVDNYSTLDANSFGVDIFEDIFEKIWQRLLDKIEKIKMKE